MEGRSVFLKPIIVNAVDPTYSWSVDDIEQEGVTTPYFNFTPAEQKEYTVKLTVTNHTPQVRSVLSRNLTQSESNTASATIQVNCVGTDNEMNRFRPYAGTERFTVMEFVAAPGQFVNAGYEATTYEEANAYAQKRLNEGNYVSLGGFGGYLTVYCSHSIVSSNGDYDFCVFGNPFDGSSEPGIVYVMQDENGDGLPNDTWYEVKGSETGKPETIQDYAITYYRSEKSAIRWSDNRETTAAWALSITELRPCIRNGSGRTATRSAERASNRGRCRKAVSGKTNRRLGLCGQLQYDRTS